MVMCVVAVAAVVGVVPVAGCMLAEGCIQSWFVMVVVAAVCGLTGVVSSRPCPWSVKSRGLLEFFGLAPLAGAAVHLASVALAVGECRCMATVMPAAAAAGSAGRAGLALPALAEVVQMALAGVAARRVPVVTAEHVCYQSVVVALFGVIARLPLLVMAECVGP